jgi:hypothetical protein
MTRSQGAKTAVVATVAFAGARGTTRGLLLAAQLAAAVACSGRTEGNVDPASCVGNGGAGGGSSLPMSVTWTDPTAAADCKVSPLSEVTYSTSAELDALLIGPWRRCSSPQAHGEEVGVEFAVDGRYYALAENACHQVVRKVGIDYGGTWAYFPPGSSDPVSPEPSPTGFMKIDGIGTNPPTITNDPRQLRILFSPVLSTYVPLTAN